MSMKKLFESWQRTLEQDEFKLTAPDLMSEVTILQLGLPAEIAEFINSRLDKASREVKVKVGQMWKNTRIAQTMGSRAMDTISSDDFARRTSDTLTDNFSISVVSTSMEYARSQGAHDPENMGDPDFEKIADKASDKAGQMIRNFKELINRHSATGADFMKADKVANRFFKKGFNGTIPDDEYKVLHDSIYDEVVRIGVNWFEFKPIYIDLFNYLNDDPDGKHFKIIKNYDLLTKAGLKAHQELVGREDPEKVFHEYDDGYYWYDIGNTDCEIEAGKMLHCGTDPRATTMYSLRVPNKDPEVEFGRDHWVTVAYNEKTKTVHQIKGRDNGPPDKKHWKKIVDLLNHLGIEKMEEDGQHTAVRSEFFPFLDWLGSDESGLKMDFKRKAWDAIKEELMSWVHKFDDEEAYAGIVIGFRMEEDADGVIRYFPLASFGAEWRGPILNEHGLKEIEKNPEKFALGTAIYLADNENYPYLPDSYSKIEKFYQHDDDAGVNPALGGRGATTGKQNYPYIRGKGYDAKLIVWTPIDTQKIVPNWALDGSAAIPGDRNDAESYVNFFLAMKRINRAYSLQRFKPAIKEAMQSANFAEGAVLLDIDQSLIHKELYTRGSIPDSSSPYRSWPTDWEFKVLRDDIWVAEIQASVPAFTLNTAALMDEHDLEPLEPHEIKPLFRTSVFGREFLKLMFEKATGKDRSRDIIPNQTFIEASTPGESRPYIFAIVWGMDITDETKDEVSKDFLKIVTKIDTKDEIVDIAEQAFVNIMKAREDTEGLDESVIKMWKRAIR